MLALSVYYCLRFVGRKQIAIVNLMLFMLFVFTFESGDKQTPESFNSVSEKEYVVEQEP